jgi:hypothetical protein
VPAGHQQRDERELRRRRFEHRREQVALHVVHADRGHAPGPGQAAPDAGAHEQRPDQPGAGRVGHPVELAGRGPGVGQHPFNQRQQLAHVIARGELRHHPAELGVQAHLAVERVREQAPPRVDDGNAGLVAGSFDAENPHCIFPLCLLAFV